MFFEFFLALALDTLENLLNQLGNTLQVILPNVIDQFPLGRVHQPGHNGFFHERIRALGSV